MIKKGHTIAGARVLVLGLTFKENCADLRNTRVIELVRELQGFSAKVDIFDPWADLAESERNKASARWLSFPHPASTTRW